ncbi:MAG: HD domain-containing protein [Erysipelotrichaceae bacterium]|nr:HD domain-containing protein [Erysipelotrichaceae bacterium]
MNNKERFIQIYKDNIHRPGSDKLLDFLMSNKSDFFEAPASSRYHNAYQGGLLDHSLNVYDCLKDYLSRTRVKDVYGLNYSEETIAIVALLHDICKTNVYKTSTRNVKENGQWIQVPYFEFNDTLPYGHGEKSVYMISGYMRLTREEAFAIRYHMGFSGSEDTRNVGAAFEMFPLCLALSTADMEATYYVEGKK